MIDDSHKQPFEKSSDVADDAERRRQAEGINTKIRELAAGRGARTRDLFKRIFNTEPPDDAA